MLLLAARSGRAGPQAFHKPGRGADRLVQQPHHDASGGQAAHGSQRVDKRLTAVFEAAGITRAATEASRKLYTRWHEAWGLSHDVILLAAEISSLSENPYRYLSTLLSNWHEAGVKTLADAQRETKKRGSRRLAAGAKPVDFAHPEEDYDRLAVNLFEDEGA